jgi:hypothetical protein
MSTSVSATSITDHELEQVERANATTATPVVLIHGLVAAAEQLGQPGRTSSARPATRR